MKQTLKELFLHPSDEYTPIPFWFWNSALSEQEITRQIEDFREKGVMGFIIHPRIGIPTDIPYLSDRFMHYVKHAVKEAARLSMKVILYDEAMYPSGSAHGMVVEGNPEYATRALRMEEYSPLQLRSLLKSDGIFSPKKEEHILSVQAVQKNEKGQVLTDSIRILPHRENGTFCIPQELFAEGWYILVFTEGFSGGTIRGIHIGEDDGEAHAPVSGDLMNPNAMDKFIRITYDRYYEVLKEYFGTTIIAMFTDEPDVLGRNHRAGSKPWTAGFLNWWEQYGGSESDLALLWMDSQAIPESRNADASSKDAASVRKQFQKAVNKRLSYSYYGKISQWCEAHGIALTGHPHESNDIGFLQYFQIPGQDLVWRWVAPENEKSLSGKDSTMAKCSSDAARHALRRRNSNECFGCCGPEGIGWAFTADDMKWYLDWMFVRGVNLLYPHAFFYSIEGEQRFGERPPDVGPHSIWWQDYRLFSDYIKRMSWLMTDSTNTTPVAILCEEDYLPWKLAGECFRNQIEFNYLEESLLLKADSSSLTDNEGQTCCQLKNGYLFVTKQKYRLLLVESPDMLSADVMKVVKAFLEQGGNVLCLASEETNLPDSRILKITEPSALIPAMDALAKDDPACREKLFLARTLGCREEIRISHVVKEGQHFYLLVNEGEYSFTGNLQIPWDTDCQAELWHPWEGTCEPCICKAENGLCTIPVALERRESLILNICKKEALQKETLQRSADRTCCTCEPAVKELLPVSVNWQIAGVVLSDNIAEALGTSKSPCRLTVSAGTDPLSDWTLWETADGASMEHFSGTVEYTAVLPEITAEGPILLDLGQVQEIARLWVNGEPAGVKLWAPYRFDITRYLVPGENHLKLEIGNSLANGISHSRRPSGLRGPVRLICKSSLSE